MCRFRCHLRDQQIDLPLYTTCHWRMWSSYLSTSYIYIAAIQVPYCEICSRESTYNRAEVHRARPVSEISLRVVPEIMPIQTQKITEFVSNGSASAFCNGGSSTAFCNGGTRVQVPEVSSATRVCVPDYSARTCFCNNTTCNTCCGYVQQEAPVVRSVVPYQSRTITTPRMVSPCLGHCDATHMDT